MLFINYCKKVLTGFLLFISLFIISISCDSTEPPANISLTLKLEDVSCTEAWLQLKTTNLQLPNNITLFINDLQSRTFNLTTADTLLYIDSLLPNQNYSFQIISFYNPEDGIKSNTVNATTMDTTSHNFTWQTFEFGQHSSSTLYDVAIIDENNIWAVGEIYMNDSLGNPDPTFYNVVHWDGNTWELKRILYQGGIWTIKTIYAFNESDIWFSGYMRYYNGNFIELTIPIILQGWSINKLWGTSSSDLYAVGNNGNIAHYQNGGWTKIESGTSIDFQDIWGADNKNGNFIKYIAADNHMLKLYEDNKVESVNFTQNMILLSIWGKTPYLLYTAGNGTVLYKNYEWETLNNSSVNHMYRVRGQEYNDVFGISSPGNIINHFNGYSWSSIETESENKYWSISVSGNTIVAVGYKLDQAVITIISK